MGARFLYALVVLLGSFLLFQVQPVAAKAILPAFGGSAAVWITCLLFFQTALLTGYLYSHGLARVLPARLQGLVHLLLLGLSVLTLPVAFSAASSASPLDPALRVLILLTVGVGLPFVALSSTSPLLQVWYARNLEQAPYRLYALANLGSLAGLLTYPIFVEPLMSLRTQLTFWSALYLCFAALCALAGWHSIRNSARKSPEVEGSSTTANASHPVETSVFLLWLLLPACSAALLLSVTNHLCQDVASVPLLWIPPLVLYLLSFVICFAWERWYRPAAIRLGAVVALAGMAILFAVKYSDFSLVVPLFLLCLFAACLFCHGELVRLKPHPQRLTTFYLAIAAGGVLGAVFVSLIASRFFPSLGELPISLAWCALLVRTLWVGRINTGQILVLIIALGVLSIMAATLPLWLASRENAFLERNFYGTLRVTDTEEDGEPIRSLHNGRILHGSQFLKSNMRRMPTTYYAETSGIGRLLRAMKRPQMRVGLVGLGAGTLAVYAKPGDHYRFFEINPLVVEVARRSFTYLRDCQGRTDVVIGDARLMLQLDPDVWYDVLAVDAFSGDSIPVHLLTRQAFALYLQKLRPGGVLAIHISNKYLDLDPLVTALAREFSMAVRIVENPSNDPLGISVARWAIVSPDAAMFSDKAWEGATTSPKSKQGLRLWTDDYSSILPLLD